MAEWSKNRVDSDLINGGQQFTPDDNLTVSELNAIVNNSFYAVDFVEAMADTPDISEIGGTGTPSVSLINNGKFKKFKFSNLRGERGEKGDQGERGEISDEQINDIKQSVLSTLYPVGSVVFRKTENFSPVSAFGFGTWTKYTAVIPANASVVGTGNALGINAHESNAYSLAIKYGGGAKCLGVVKYPPASAGYDPGDQTWYEMTRALVGVSTDAGYSGLQLDTAQTIYYWIRTA